MFLYAVQIENYRAIRRADLSFDESTVLIGENDSGKSSLLEVLSRVLDPAAGERLPTFSRFQFHRPEGGNEPSGPIRITLHFRERLSGDWSGSGFTSIAPLLPPQGRQPREITLDLSALPPATDSAVSTAGCKVYSRGGKEESSRPDLLRWIRATSPVIHLTPGMLTGHGIQSLPALEPAAARSACTDGSRQLVERIDRCALALLSGSSMDMSADLERGFSAASELIERVADESGGRGLGLARKVKEILGREFHEANQVPAGMGLAYRSNAERLGVLLLIAALLRVSPQGLDTDMEPIWVIEDPEAHLHPMTLTSVTLLLAHIKWQKIITTYSGELLASVPLKQVRRLIRFQGVLHERRVNEHSLSREDLRRINYHLRAHHGTSSFARLWLFVEGESEFWIMPQLARLMGYEFALEGISCIEFAQSGLKPLIKAAYQLGVEWHLLADGDDAGQSYLEMARRLIPEDDDGRRLTLLPQRDIEHCFWENGYAGLYRHHASMAGSHRLKPDQVIQKAIRHRSKPYLALSAIEAMAESGSPGIPPILREMVEVCVSMAREGPAHIAGDTWGPQRQG